MHLYPLVWAVIEERLDIVSLYPHLSSLPIENIEYYVEKTLNILSDIIVSSIEDLKHLPHSDKNIKRVRDRIISDCCLLSPVDATGVNAYYALEEVADDISSCLNLKVKEEFILPEGGAMYKCTMTIKL